MNADKTNADMVSRLARNGLFRSTSSGSLSHDLLKPVTIIIARKLLKPEG
jgi:hypothetical protein